MQVGSNYFQSFLQKTDEKSLYKMKHYPEIYNELLANWQGRAVSFLEIGVFKGGSLRMWRDFFSENSKMTFLNIDPACKALEIQGVEILIGNQEDTNFLQKVIKSKGPFDLIVDDGSHFMSQQITSFQHLWPALNDKGIYVVEDTHTSYWPGFEGGYKNPNSFVEFAKDLIDKMHSWYREDDPNFPFDPLAREIGSISFYDSMIVIKKDIKDPPVSIVSQDGKVAFSSRIIETKNRVSIFKKPKI